MVFCLLMADLILVVGGFTEQGIPENSRNARVRGVQAPSNPVLGVVGKVLGVVDPPSPVIIPQMMERVGVGPDREDGLAGVCSGACCFAHVRDVWVVTSGTRATKKRRSNQERRFI